MITGFNHSGFVVKNLEKMVSFYRDDLGLKGGEHALELVYFIHPKSPSGHLDRNQLGASHICFNVEKIEELYENLLSKGIKFVTPPIMSVTEDGKEKGICYCQDPEGNWIEFIQS